MAPGGNRTADGRVVRTQLARGHHEPIEAQPWTGARLLVRACPGTADQQGYDRLGAQRPADDVSHVVIPRMDGRGHSGLPLAEPLDERGRQHVSGETAPLRDDVGAPPTPRTALGRAARQRPPPVEPTRRES